MSKNDDGGGSGLFSMIFSSYIEMFWPGFEASSPLDKIRVRAHDLISHVDF